LDIVVHSECHNQSNRSHRWYTRLRRLIGAGSHGRNTYDGASQLPALAAVTAQRERRSSTGLSLSLGRSSSVSLQGCNNAVGDIVDLHELQSVRRAQPRAGSDGADRSSEEAAVVGQSAPWHGDASGVGTHAIQVDRREQEMLQRSWKR